MDLQKLNEIVTDLSFYNLKTKLGEPVKVTKGSDGDNSVDYGNTEYIFKLPFDELYIKLKMTENSYGGEDLIEGIEFVKAKIVPTTVFETI